ncbi:MAG: digeranylgeranylglyceryl phosphate synthase, partial [Candidatus Bathyarchaeia archaeon]
MGKAIGLIRIIRPINSLMMGFAVIVGAFLAAQGLISENDVANLVLGSITAITLTGASMAINDYYDR